MDPGSGPGQYVLYIYIRILIVLLSKCYSLLITRSASSIGQRAPLSPHGVYTIVATCLQPLLCGGHTVTVGPPGRAS